MSTPSKDHIVIVGSGLIGTLSAWYLQKAGHRVTLLDAGKFGAACSHANCGYVSPSHVLPLPAPGVIPKTLGAMLSPNSPFSIKPRVSPELWRWLLNFAWRCRRQPMLDTAVTRHQLLQSSLQKYHQILEETGIDCQFQSKGLLFVFATEKEFQHYQATQDLLDQLGAPAKRYGRDDLLNLEPALKDNVAGGYHYEADCHLRPDLLLKELRKRLEAGGATILEDCRIQSFCGKQGRAFAAATEGDKAIQIEGDQFVVATGAMTPWLNEALGIKIPIQPGKGYSITTTPADGLPTHPMILEEYKVAITPFQDRFRIGSTMEFAGYDTRLSEPRLELLRNGARQCLKVPYGEEVVEKWYGWRPMTWDGKPFIDRCPSFRNVWVAAGHNMLGLSMAPASGKLVQELIDGEIPHINPRPLSLERIRKW